MRSAGCNEIRPYQQVPFRSRNRGDRMFNIIAFLILAILLVAMAGSLVGAVHAAHRDIQNHKSLLTLTAERDRERAALDRAQAELQVQVTNSKHGKAYRELHDRAERAQFAAIKARDAALDAAKMYDTAAAHLAGEIKQ